MIYSVLTAPGQYTYFEAPGVFPATGRYLKPHGAPVRGMFTVEQFTDPLPSGAVKVGTGPDAKGMLAKTGSALGAWHDTAPGKVAVQVAGGVIVLWVARKLWR